MYKELINCNVNVMVSTKGDTILEYNGILVSEDETSIILKNVSINYAMLNFQKNIFGGNINSYKENVEEVIINKNYIISCNK